MESLKARLILSTFISLFVFLFLAILEPFHINLLQSENKLFIIAGYGLLCWACLLLFYVLLPSIFTSVFDETKWMVYKEIIWLLFNVVFIGIAITIYEDLIGSRPMQLLHFVESVGKTIIIGIIPITGLTFYNRFRLLKKHLQEANEISKEVIKNQKTSTSAHPESYFVEIESDNKSETFGCDLRDLLYVSSLGNYVEICCLKEHKKQKTILRTSLHKVEKTLESYPEIFRCHRTYLVNLKRIVNIEGNAKGYELYFEIEDIIVPVSKRKTAMFRALINQK